MRRNMIPWTHVETSSHRCETCCPGAGGAGPGGHRQPTACRTGDSFAGLGAYDLGTDGGAAGREPCRRGAVAAAIPRRAPTRIFLPSPLGRTTAGSADRGARGGLPDALGRTSSRCRGVGGRTAAGGAGRKAGSHGRTLGRVPSIGAAGVAESGSRDPASEKRSGRASRVEKNSPKRWQPS